MLATIIIVLREILEICLSVGVVFAALKAFPNKWRLLFSGIGAGIGMSIVLALAFYKISNLFNGNGQEILNIIILSSSIICIALTMLWINRSVQELHKKVAIAKVQESCLPIILVISLAIAREGAELTLFIHGVAASGTGTAELISGFIVGSIIGTTLGALMYAGLLKIPARYFFKTINVMLALLAAGMSSQLANYLTAANIIDKLSTTLWNSSWLISDESLLGRILHGLVGYYSAPSQLQVVFYFSTLLAILLIMKCNSRKAL